MSLFVKKKLTHAGGMIAALDIGSSKISCAIATPSSIDRTGLKLIGLGQQSSKGIKSGTITDMEALEDSILNAVHTAEQNAEQTIGGLYVSLPGNFIKSKIVEIEVSLGSEAVSSHHLRHLLTLGKHSQEFKNVQIIHALPIHYSLDGQHEIRDAKGMFGNVLRAKIHLLTVPRTVLKNITACIGRCHLDVSGFVVASYASGLATLVDDELELGVTVIDIGGGTTTVASFLHGALVHVASIPVGGYHITSDIARGLSTPLSQAERLKTLYGSVFPLGVDDREHINVPQMGDGQTLLAQQVSKSLFMKIIKARVEEIFELVRKNLQNSAIPNLIAQRIVLTGGGSQLPGMSEYAQHVWRCSVRLGFPTGFQAGSDTTQNPSFSTCAGLLHYAHRDEKSYGSEILSPHQGHLWQSFLGWFRENF